MSNILLIFLIGCVMTDFVDKVPNNTALYKAKCASGLCVKNNAVGLPKVFDNISKIRMLFEECSVIAYYDASSDDSLSLLAPW